MLDIIDNDLKRPFFKYVWGSRVVILIQVVLGIGLSLFLTYLKMNLFVAHIFFYLFLLFSSWLIILCYMKKFKVKFSEVYIFFIENLIKEEVKVLQNLNIYPYQDKLILFLNYYKDRLPQKVFFPKLSSIIFAGLTTIIPYLFDEGKMYIAKVLIALLVLYLIFLIFSYFYKISVSDLFTKRIYDNVIYECLFLIYCRTFNNNLKLIPLKREAAILKRR